MAAQLSECADATRLFTESSHCLLSVLCVFSKKAMTGRGLSDLVFTSRSI